MIAVSCLYLYNDLCKNSILKSFFPLQVITVKLLYSNVSETSMNSSDNSTDSSEGSPTGHLDGGPNIEMEKMIPSVVR